MGTRKKIALLEDQLAALTTTGTRFRNDIRYYSNAIRDLTNYATTIDEATENRFDSWEIRQMLGVEDNGEWYWSVRGEKPVIGGDGTRGTRLGAVLEQGLAKTYAKARRDMGIAMVLINQQVPKSEPRAMVGSEG